MSLSRRKYLRPHEIEKAFGVAWPDVRQKLWDAGLLSHVVHRNKGTYLPTDFAIQNKIAWRETAKRPSYGWLASYIKQLIVGEVY